MQRAFNKEITRSISRSASRFLAILAIVALGAGFYAGLRMTSPHMRLTTDAYLDGTAFMDVHLLSTLGFSDADVQAVRQVEGVSAVMPTYVADVTATIAGRRETMRVHALDIEAAAASDTSSGRSAVSEDADYLNRPLLVAGRWPTTSGECVIDKNSVYESAAELGETVTFTDGVAPLEDTFVRSDFEVVGVVDSSYYLSFTRGTTPLNDGNIDRFMYMSDADFATGGVYTDLFLTVRGAEAVSTFTPAYDEIVEPVATALQDLAPGRAAERLDEIRAEAQVTLDEARSEYEQGRAEAEAALAEGQAELDAAAEEIAASRAELDRGQSRYKGGVRQLRAERQAFAARSAEAQAQLDAAAAQLATQQAQLDQLAALVAGLEQQVAADGAEVAGVQAAYEQALAEEALGNTVSPSSAELAVSLAEAQSRLAAAEGALAEQRATLDAGTAQLALARQELDSQHAALEEGRLVAAAGFAAAQRELDATARLLREGRAELAAGEAAFDEAGATYATEKADAERQLAEGLAEIEKAQAEVDELDAPQWHVLGRGTNLGYASLAADADRITAISLVFPLIFFLVAALVALTTMTRMVDEERTLIGTYKALGYGRWRIASKYVAYAGAASVIGAVVGIAAGSQILPRTVWRAYTTMYTAPPIMTPVDWRIALLAWAASVGVTSLATLLAVEATLREAPSALLLPKAPRPGKRILLERVRPVWRRLSFSHKVTARNLFRYKKRLLMTVIGIAGCTALLLTGFGLRDSIGDVLSKQYGEIYRYDTIIGLQASSAWADTSASAGIADPEALAGDPKRFSGYLAMHTEGIMMSNPDRLPPERTDESTDTAAVRGFGEEDDGDRDEIHGYISCPLDVDRTSDFFALRERRTGRQLVLDDSGVFLTEKVADELGLRVGDEVRVERLDVASPEEEAAFVTFRVAGITEQYVSHYLYVTPALYEEVVGHAPSRNQVVAKSRAENAEEREDVSRSLLEQPGVTTVQFTSDVTASFDDMLASLDEVMLILIVSAGMLAFIVLYNLTNINITERKREIATIKVLGFFESEVNAYIYRETAVLALLGCALGLLLGIALEAFVITTVEIDIVMFGRTIHPPSYVYSAALTLLFAVIVNLAMRPRLRAIDMVESLKSVE